ncbi:MAG: cold-shock protein [Candidatus Lokiarchaeota archaeon]|jgi:CspA family cold shock protein|nr:cold-shock protein [Candidatus Lokiarchaeota archaeon]MBD3202597.1 cold-shock protein [Candidatus Lokiarchaeota archaeon]
MPTGTVKWFNGKKGYGFIITDEGTDIFVHYSALKGDDDQYKTLNEGDKVTFEIVEGKKGPQASEVEVTEKAARSRNPYSKGRKNLRF